MPIKLGYSSKATIGFIKQVITQIAKDKNISEVSFSHIRKDSKLYEALVLFNLFNFNIVKCVSIALDDCYDIHLKGLRKSVRQNLRTANNRIHEDNVAKEITFLTSEEAESIDFQSLKEIYKKRNSTKRFSTLKNSLNTFPPSPINGRKNTAKIAKGAFKIKTWI